jgi:hypothetical protein
MVDSPSSDLEEQIRTISEPDDLYWELDEDDYAITPTPTEQPIKNKIVSRNVGNTRRRRFR